MKLLELKKELDLDKPEDIDWLVEWSKQAWQRIQELESKLNTQVKTVDKDVTNECIYGEVDDELLPLRKCVCGREFKFWDAILSIDRNHLFECECGRMLYFSNKIIIYEIGEE